MATTSEGTATVDAAGGATTAGMHADEHHAEHPSDAKYIKVAVVLAAITALEVGLYYVPVPGVRLNNTALGLLAIVKFAVVVLYFMHLKFDSRTLRRLFVTGLVLAMFCYIILLRSLGIWG